MKTARNLLLAAILTTVPTALSAAFGVIELTASKPQAVQFPSEIAAVTIFSTVPPAPTSSLNSSQTLPKPLPNT